MLVPASPPPLEDDPDPPDDADVPPDELPDEVPDEDPEGEPDDEEDEDEDEDDDDDDDVAPDDEELGPDDDPFAPELAPPLDDEPDELSVEGEFPHLATSSEARASGKTRGSCARSGANAGRGVVRLR
jgi:hypothetical protein